MLSHAAQTRLDIIKEILTSLETQVQSLAEILKNHPDPEAFNALLVKEFQNITSYPVSDHGREHAKNYYEQCGVPEGEVKPFEINSSLDHADKIQTLMRDWNVVRAFANESDTKEFQRIERLSVMKNLLKAKLFTREYLARVFEIPSSAINIFNNGLEIISLEKRINYGELTPRNLFSDIFCKDDYVEMLFSDPEAALLIGNVFYWLDSHDLLNDASRKKILTLDQVQLQFLSASTTHKLNPELEIEYKNSLEQALLDNIAFLQAEEKMPEVKLTLSNELPPINVPVNALKQALDFHQQHLALTKEPKVDYTEIKKLIEIANESTAEQLELTPEQLFDLVNAVTHIENEKNYSAAYQTFREIAQEAKLLENMFGPERAKYFKNMRRSHPSALGYAAAFLVEAKDYDHLRYAFFQIGHGSPLEHSYEKNEYPKIKKNIMSLHIINRFMSERDQDKMIAVANAIDWLTSLDLATPERLQFVNDNYLGIHLLNHFQFKKKNFTFAEMQAFAKYTFRIVMPVIIERHQRLFQENYILPMQEQLNIANDLLNQVKELAEIAIAHPNQSRFLVELDKPLQKINSQSLSVRYKRDYRENLKYPAIKHQEFEAQKKLALDKGEQFFAEEDDNNTISLSEKKYNQEKLLKKLRLEAIGDESIPLLHADKIEKLKRVWENLFLQGSDEYPEVIERIERIESVYHLFLMGLFQPKFINQLFAIPSQYVPTMRSALSVLSYGKSSSSEVKYIATELDVQTVLNDPENSSTLAGAILWLNLYGNLNPTSRQQMLSMPAKNLAHIFSLEIRSYFNHGKHHDLVAKEFFDSLINFPVTPSEFENLSPQSSYQIPTQTVDTEILKSLIETIDAKEDNALLQEISFKNKTELTHAEILVLLDECSKKKAYRNNSDEAKTTWNQTLAFLEKLFNKEISKYLSNAWKREHRTRCLLNEDIHVMAFQVKPELLERFWTYALLLTGGQIIGPFFTEWPKDLFRIAISIHELETIMHLLHEPHTTLREVTCGLYWLGILALSTPERLLVIEKNAHTLHLLTDIQITHAKQMTKIEAQTFGKFIFDVVSKLMPSAELQEQQKMAETPKEQKEDLSVDEIRERHQIKQPRNFMSMTKTKDDKLFIYRIDAIPNNESKELEYSFIVKDEKQNILLTFIEKVDLRNLQAIFITPTIAIIKLVELNDNEIKFFDIKTQTCFYSQKGTYNKCIDYHLLDDERILFYIENKLTIYNFITRTETEVIQRHNPPMIRNFYGEINQHLVVGNYDHFTILANKQDEKNITVRDKIASLLKITDEKWLYVKEVYRRMPTNSLTSSFAFAKSILHLIHFDQASQQFTKQQKWIIGHTPEKMLLTDDNILLYQDLDQIYGLDLNNAEAEPKSLWTHPTGFYDHPGLEFTVLDNTLHILQASHDMSTHDAKIFSYKLYSLRDFLKQADNSNLELQLKSGHTSFTYSPAEKDSTPIGIWQQRNRLVIDASHSGITSNNSALWNKATVETKKLEDISPNRSLTK